MAHTTRRTVLLVVLLFSALAAAAYTPDPPLEIDIDDTEEEGTATLVLETNKSGADIYLNKVFVGRTPHVQRGLPPGIHVVRLELEGYRPRELVLEVQEKRTYTIRVALVPRTGWLSVSATPAAARITVDGDILVFSPVELSIGPHRVSAYLFGYEEASQIVFVREDAVASAAFALRPAAFEVSELRVRRPSFNPANAGALGRAEIRFTVTSFGRAELEVRAASGAVVAVIQTGPFSDREQLAVWNGRDEGNRPLPDGEYSVFLRAFPEASEAVGLPAPEAVERSSKVFIDSSLVVAPRGLASGVSGLSLYPDPFVDPAKTLRFHSGWKPLMDAEGGFKSSAILLGAQAAPGGGFEIALQGALDPEDGDSLAAGLGVKRTLFSAGSFSSAAYLGLSYCAPSMTEEPAAPSAVRLGLSGAFGTIRLHGGLALEMNMPTWDDAAPRLEGRAGFYLTDGVRSAGLSARARTESLDGGFELADEVSAVLEARTFLSPLPVTMGLALGADFGSGGFLALRPAVELSIIF